MKVKNLKVKEIEAQRQASGGQLSASEGAKLRRLLCEKRQAEEEIEQLKEEIECISERKNKLQEEHDGRQEDTENNAPASDSILQSDRDYFASLGLDVEVNTTDYQPLNFNDL